MLNIKNKDRYEQLLLNNITNGIRGPLAATISEIVKESITAKDFTVYKKFDSVENIKDYDIIVMFGIADDDPLFGMFFNVDEPRLVVGTSSGIVNIDL